jgi:predicted aspartyl protease
VDTGTSSIALSAADARKLGFSWTEQELKRVGSGVSGPVSGKFVKLHRMRLGSKDAWDMEAAIIPHVVRGKSRIGPPKLVSPVRIFFLTLHRPMPIGNREDQG